MKNLLFSFLFLFIIAILFSFSFQNDLAASIKRGSNIYASNCIACHMENGEGLAGAFPPLKGSDYLKDKKKVIQAMINGLQGEIIVNGKKYNNVMPASGLNNKEIADVLTYVNNTWGNKGARITEQEVAAERKKKK
jgi:mono/diheme cytochrome c family protein